MTPDFRSVIIKAVRKLSNSTTGLIPRNLGEIDAFLSRWPATGEGVKP